MMGRKKARYTAKFKQEAIKYHENIGKAAGRTSEVHKLCLQKWDPQRERIKCAFHGTNPSPWKLKTGYMKS
jgi:hypothetical protein